jgi:membrane-associated phospholipid phosphatase
LGTEAAAPQPVAPPRLGRFRGAARRRRPSGEPPPLPRELRRSGRFWVWTLSAIGLLYVVGFFVSRTTGAALAVERWDDAVLRAIAHLRTPWLTRGARGAAVMGSDNVNLVLRWAVVVALIWFRRWRQLAVFIGAVLVLGWIGTVLPIVIARPRPVGVPILGSWSGFSLPSAPVAALAGTLLGIGFTMFPDGKWKIRWFWATDVVVVVLALSRMYLAVDHVTDVLFGGLLGMGIVVLAFRLFCPEDVFPVTYGTRGRSAHLDLGGRRGDAIRRAIQDQIGLRVLDLKAFGLGGSGGSTPMKIRVADAGDREFEVFGKLYASTHLRADRNYKLMRTIRNGRLEDEKPYTSVRHLVEYEDYMLRVMRDSGIGVAATYGFVEITPEREYLLLTEFLEGTREIGDVEVDQQVMDTALRIVRSLWDAGLAHRDVKPANVLVRGDQALIIDVAFAEIRPSPWRQAVDLANMMLLLGFKADPKLVYERAIAPGMFTPQEVAEAFAAVQGAAIPSQSHGMLKELRKRTGRDLIEDFRGMGPATERVSIQRWSLRRIMVTAGTAVLILLAILLAVGNLQGAGLR